MGNIPVTTRSLSDADFATLLLDSAHATVADEPAALGGSGLGPDPYDLLLMALGSCTSMTVRLHARRRGFPLEQVRVELTHTRVHADDCAECERRDVYVEIIDRRITLAGQLTTEQTSDLLAIANRCPVHRSLSGRIEIRTFLLGQQGTGTDT